MGGRAPLSPLCADVDLFWQKRHGHFFQPFFLWIPQLNVLGQKSIVFFPAHLSAALEREGEVRQAAIPAFPLRSSSTHHFLWAVDVARPSECTNLGMFKTRTAMNVQNPREMNKTTARTALTHCIWAFTARVVWHGWVGGWVGVSTQR